MLRHTSVEEVGGGAVKQTNEGYPVANPLSRRASNIAERSTLLNAFWISRAGQTCPGWLPGSASTPRYTR